MRTLLLLAFLVGAWDRSEAQELFSIKTPGGILIFDETGKVQEKLEGQLIGADRRSRNGRLVAYDDSGTWIFKSGEKKLLTSAEGDYWFVHTVHPSGLFAVASKGENNSRQGIIDENGEMIIPVKYQAVGMFSSGFALVKYVNNDIWAVIDTTGKLVLNLNCEKVIGGGENGIFPCFLEGKWYFFNTLTMKYLPLVVDELSAWNESNDNLDIVRIGKKSCAIEFPSGKILFELPDDHRSRGFMAGLAVCSDSEKGGFIVYTKKGKVAFSLSAAKDVGYHYKKYLSVLDKEGRYYIVDHDGKRVGLPVGVKLLSFFSSGTAEILKDGKKGILTTELKVIIPVE